MRRRAFWAMNWLCNVAITARELRPIGSPWRAWCFSVADWALDRQFELLPRVTR